MDSVVTHSLAARSTLQDLYEAHHGWLQGWLSKKLGSPFDAADLAQDTFLRVLHRRGDEVQQGLAVPRAYLTTIASGLVVEHWRRRALERAWLDLLVHLPEPEAPSPETRLMFLQALIRIDTLLDGLKQQVRTAFLWARLEGLTCPEIARRLGVSLATAERYVATALRHCYALHFGESRRARQ
ncbi:MAG: sigma-70 family RNA polymerase sigma factor [Pararobbsia sp.]